MKCISYKFKDFSSLRFVRNDRTKMHYHGKTIQTIFILCCVFFIATTTYSSDTTKIQYLTETKFHYGFILPHAKDLRKWKTTYPFGVQADFGWYRNPDKSWEQCNCYAKTGFSFIWFNLGNPEILGHSYNLLYYYEPLLGYKNNLYLSLKAGMGPSFLSKVYDENSNPENQFFSTKISYLLLVHLNLNYQLNNQWKLNLSACYNHISNGGLKQPNRGMNFPTINAGIQYSLTPKHLPERDLTRTTNYFKEKIRYDISFYGTGKHIGSSHGKDDKVLPVFGFYTSASKRLSRMSAIIGGAEWVSDGYVKELMDRRNENTDHKNAALFLGHELLIGKIIFSQLLCIYVYQPYVGDEDDAVYQRYGLRYQVSKHFHAGITLKAHRHVAHIFDVRIGYNF